MPSLLACCKCIWFGERGEVNFSECVWNVRCHAARVWEEKVREAEGLIALSRTKISGLALKHQISLNSWRWFELTSDRFLKFVDLLKNSVIWLIHWLRELSSKTLFLDVLDIFSLDISQISSNLLRKSICNITACILCKLVGRCQEEFWFLKVAAVSCILDNLILSTGLTMWIDHRKEIRKLTFGALALRRSEGLALETSASESLCGGQFTLSTQLIKPDYLVILPNYAAPQLPPLLVYIWFAGDGEGG